MDIPTALFSKIKPTDLKPVVILGYESFFFSFFVRCRNNAYLKYRVIHIRVLTGCYLTLNKTRREPRLTEINRPTKHTDRTNRHTDQANRPTDRPTNLPTHKTPRWSHPSPGSTTAAAVGAAVQGPERTQPHPAGRHRQLQLLQRRLEGLHCFRHYRLFLEPHPRRGYPPL